MSIIQIKKTESNLNEILKIKDMRFFNINLTKYFLYKILYKKYIQYFSFIYRNDIILYKEMKYYKNNPFNNNISIYINYVLNMLFK